MVLMTAERLAGAAIALQLSCWYLINLRTLKATNSSAAMRWLCISVALLGRRVLVLSRAVGLTLTRQVRIDVNDLSSEYTEEAYTYYVFGCVLNLCAMVSSSRASLLLRMPPLPLLTTDCSTIARAAPFTAFSIVASH